MKKFLAILLSILMAVSFAACSNSTNDNKSKESKQSADVQSGDITNASSNEQIAAYYNEVMKISKADKSLQGDDELSIGDVNINGKTNETTKSMITSIGNSAIKAFSGDDYEVYLPYIDKAVEVLPQDIESFNVTDNGDTLTLKITPVKEENVSKRLNGPQGRFFEVYEDIQGAVSQVSQISFPDGVENSLIIDYYGGSVEFKIDKKTKKVISGTTHMVAILNITNAKVAVINLRNATISLNYKVTYPKAVE